MRIIVGVTGASGVEMSYYLARALRRVEQMEIFLILSEGAKLTWGLECERELKELTDLADRVLDNANLAACISSGSFVTHGMIVMPCSMKSLAGIVTGYADTLITRAADVCMKEGRRVVLVPREMPLSRLHLRNLKEAADLGCVIVPPVLTFYNGAKTMEEQIDHIIGKILLQFGLSYDGFHPWNEKKKDSEGA